MRNVALTLAAAALLAGCASDPSSYLDGRRYNRAEMFTYDLTIIAVDGQSTLAYPVRVEPGRRTVILQAPPVAGFSEGTKQTVELDIEPCKRYHLAALRKNALAQDWTLKVDHVAEIGCWPRK